jgi:hypothetical protein
MHLIVNRMRKTVQILSRAMALKLLITISIDAMLHLSAFNLLPM